MNISRTPFRHAALAVATLGLAACSDRLPTQGGSPAPGAVSRTRIDCVAQVRSGELRCNTPGTAAARANVILGGQGTRVLLASKGTVYDSATTTLQSQVTVQNLLAQPLGTPDGTAVTGVNVFFASGPTVQAGQGSVEVLADSVGTFTATGQLYYHYPQIVAPGAVSSPRAWRFSVPPSVIEFTFTVFVETRLQAESGVLRFTRVDPHPGSSTVRLEDVWSPNGRLVVAVGSWSNPVTGADDGVVTRSTDGGASWTADTIAGAAFKSVWGTSTASVWAVGTGGGIFRSADGGVSWTNVAPPAATRFNFNGVWASPAGTVFVAGMEQQPVTSQLAGVVLSSTDGGATWSKTQTTPSTGDRLLFDVWGSSAAELWIGGAEVSNVGVVNGFVMHSTDGGATWSEQSLARQTASLVAAVWAAPGAGVYAAGGLSYLGPQVGILLHSAGGGTWSTEPLTGPDGASEFTGVWGAGPGDVYVSGGAGMIQRWTGSRWVALASGTTEHLLGIFGTSSRDVWAVGLHGAILHGVR